MLEKLLSKFIFRFSSSNVDAILVAMSERATISQQPKLLEAIDSLEGKLNPNTKAQATKKITANNDWMESPSFVNVLVSLDEYYKAQDEIENQLRLPRTSQPENYRLHVYAEKIPTGSREFSGEVEIDVYVRDTTSYIIFHSKSQTIEDLKVFTRVGQVEITILDYHLYPDADTLTIYFMEDIEADSQLTVKIKYAGTLLTSATGYGFYQTSYVINGETRYLGATNFESSVSTRYAFPQYDEPGFKAVFQVTITHHEVHHAISNTLGTAAQK